MNNVRCPQAKSASRLRPGWFRKKWTVPHLPHLEFPPASPTRASCLDADSRKAVPLGPDPTREPRGQREAWLSGTYWGPPTGRGSGPPS